MVKYECWNVTAFIFYHLYFILLMFFVKLVNRQFQTENEETSASILFLVLSKIRQIPIVIKM
jgi:hypothetical protein